MCGVTNRECMPMFEHMLWRVCCGNVFVRQSELDQLHQDPITVNVCLKGWVVCVWRGGLCVFEGVGCVCVFERVGCVCLKGWDVYVWRWVCVRCLYFFIFWLSNFFYKWDYWLVRSCVYDFFYYLYYFYFLYYIKRVLTKRQKEIRKKKSSHYKTWA